jgi:CheY-like chemotaxis protein
MISPWRWKAPSPRRLAPFALLAAIALTGGSGVWTYLSLDRENTEQQVLREVGALADTLAAQGGAILGGLDQMLIGVGAGNDTRPPLATLSMRENAAPDGISVMLLDASGTVLLATPQALTRLTGLAPGALPALARAVPVALGHRQMFIAPPLWSSSGFMLPLVQRAEGNRIALALLPTELLEGFYAGLQLGRGANVTLLGHDARLLARTPALAPETIGAIVPGMPKLAAALARQASWSGILHSTLDGQSRFTALRPLPGYPLAIAVGLRDSDAMLRWQQRATLGATLTALLIAAAALAILLLEREARRRLAAQSAATQRLRQLADAAAGMAVRTELPALLGFIARLTRETLATPYACVSLYDEVATQPAPPQQTTVGAAGTPFAADTVAALDHWSASDAAATLQAQAHPVEDGLPPRLGIAMRCERGGVLGTLTAASPVAGFSADEEATLAQLARVASIAIRNRRLLAAAQRATAEAGTARERIERLLGAMEDGFLALDATWCITYANPAALRFARRPLPLGQPIWALFPQLVPLPVFDHLHAVASLGTPRVFELSLPASQRRIRVNAFAAGDGVAIFFRDLTATPGQPAPEAYLPPAQLLPAHLPEAQLPAAQLLPAQLTQPQARPAQTPAAPVPVAHTPFTRAPMAHAPQAELAARLALATAEDFAAILAAAGRLQAPPGSPARPDRQAADALRVLEAAERGAQQARRLHALLGGQPTAMPADPATPSTATQEHVLLVEDEAPLRDNLTRQLGQMGYRVTALEGGPAALAALDEGLRPDVLLSDVIMPGGISGPRLATLAREKLPGLPVLLMSGYALSEEETHPTGEALLAKPCDRSTLAARLQKIMYGGSQRPA